MRSTAEEKGKATERDESQQKRLDRLERLQDERDQPRRPDYDYDMIPRRSVPSPQPRKEPEP
jgi:hypothetical protein